MQSNGESSARLLPIFFFAAALGAVFLGLAGAFWWGGRALNPPVAISSPSCRSCHAAEFDRWASSHHRWAERPVSMELDRAAFVPVHVFQAGAQTNEARFEGGQFQIVTLGLSSNIAPCRVERVIGVEPLRQFLTPLADGRWQAQEDSYDPRSNSWFDVFGDENRRPGEWGHWTGRGMNWNSQCAACHNTRLAKNYAAATDSYRTTMDETGVGCGACHGSLAEHTAWQQAHPGGAGRDPTLTPPAPAQIIATCGSCHSRRTELTGRFAAGDSFFDHYQLQIVDDTDTWFADGQVHDEDYEFASFLGSKMSRRGVLCLDCHDPHSAKLLLPGNNLCLRCHSGGFSNAPVIVPIEHSHHAAPGAAAGNECVGCHMPVTFYMQRHARRDHGLTISDPLLTKELNIPNACNRCHADKTADWSLQYTGQWYGKKMDRPTRQRARWIAAAQKAEDSANAPLIALLTGEEKIPYWRAVAAGLLWHWAGDPAVKAALLAATKDPDPLVREKAVTALEPLAGEEAEDVTAALQAMLGDPSRNVRLAAAWALKASVDAQSRAGRELQAMLDFNADQPGGQYRKAEYDLARKQPEAALAGLRLAEKWDPFSPPIHSVLAPLLAQMGMPEEAVSEWQALCRLEPNSAENQCQLGLALARVGRLEEARAAAQAALKAQSAYPAARELLDLLNQRPNH